MKKMPKKPAVIGKSQPPFKTKPPKGAKDYGKGLGG